MGHNYKNLCVGVLLFLARDTNGFSHLHPLARSSSSSSRRYFPTWSSLAAQNENAGDSTEDYSTDEKTASASTTTTPTTPTKQSKNGFLRGLIDFQNTLLNEGTPHPPYSPPPNDVLEPYFLTNAEKVAARNVEDSFSSMEGGMMMTDDRREMMRYRQVRTPLSERAPGTSTDPALVQATYRAVNPVLRGEMEPQVPDQAIKGALTAGVVLSALAGKGVVVSSAAGLGAAYVAITTGPLGQAMRAVGGLTWDVVTGMAAAYQKADQEGTVDAFLEKLSKMDPSYWKQFADKMYLFEDPAAKAEKARKREMAQRSLLAYRMTLEVADAKRRKIQAEKDRIAKEARLVEEARLAEELRIAEEARLAEEARIAAEAAAEAKRLEEERLEAERKAAAEEARARLEEERLAAEAEAKRLEEEKLAAEEAERLARIEEERLAAEAEARRLEEEQLAVEEAERLARLEEERLAREQAEQLAAAKAQEDGMMDESDDEDIFFDEDEDDWEASIMAAQESIEGKIAGLDDALMDDDGDNEMEGWKSAGEMAKDLGKALAVEDDEDEEEEIDFDEMGRAAREAVAAFEQGLEASENETAQRKQQWEDEMFDFEEEDDEEDVYDEIDFALPDDMESLAAAARAAVELAGSEYDLSAIDLTDEEVEESDFEDIGAAARQAVEATNAAPPPSENWSAMTVSQLRGELKDRGLPTSGRKADLVALLEESVLDLQRDSGEDDDDDNDEDLLLDVFDRINGLDFSGIDSEEGELEPGFELDDEGSFLSDKTDWSGFTVAQLREESQARGLPTTGRKVELVANLEEYEELMIATDDDDEVMFGEGDDENDTEAEHGEEDEYEYEAEEEYEWEPDFSQMTVSELKDELRQRNLRVSGKKQELIARLTSATSRQ